MGSTLVLGEPQVSINASNANASGIEFVINSPGEISIGWVVEVSGGTYDPDLDVRLEGAITTPWKQLDQVTDPSGDAMRSVVAECPLKLRARKVAGSVAAGTPVITVTILVRGSR